MTGWDILNEIMKNLPPIVAMLFLLTAGIIFAIGFFRHGVNFIKYGFKQIVLDALLEKRFNGFEKHFDKLEARIEAIETNHFGHLKNYLAILNGVLLDKQIIDNETKARLDNELRGM